MATKEPARESLMGWYSQRFGEDVGQVLVAFDVEELEHLLRDPVSNHMVFHIDVLCLVRLLFTTFCAMQPAPMLSR